MAVPREFQTDFRPWNQESRLDLAQPGRVLTSFNGIADISLRLAWAMQRDGHNRIKPVALPIDFLGFFPLSSLDAGRGFVGSEQHQHPVAD